MTSPRNVAASELPESLRARIQALSAASDLLAIEGDSAQIVGHIVSPEQLQRLLEDAYTEKLLDEVHAVVQEVRAEQAAEAAKTAEQREPREVHTRRPPMRRICRDAPALPLSP